MSEIRKDFERAFSIWYQFGEKSYPGTPEAHHCALWAAKWMAERLAYEFDYKLINTQSKESLKIRQLSKELDHA